MATPGLTGPLLQLERIRVEGLLGRFDHEIRFPADWEFVILHGPNGVGKTKLLELINALGNRQLLTFFETPFDRSEFAFTDGTMLSCAKVVQEPLPEMEAGDGEEEQLHFVVRVDGVETPYVLNRSQVALSNRRLRMVEQRVPLDRVEANLSYDHQSDEYIDRAAVAARYGHSKGVAHKDFPTELNDFLDRFKVHLIETQRLIQVAPVAPGMPHARQPPVTTVMQYANDLTTRLREALAENSQTSQQLDRSFPRRVLDRQAPPEATEQEIRDRYARQSALRAELSEIAVLDASFDDLPLPDRQLENWERRMLWIYLEDADKKLATFRYLLARVELLKRIVNARFLFNELVIDRERGFKFITDSGEIETDALSSGEQHELVLLYDLLFNVQPETTVLIDEPELSLHVTWQQRFLNDVVEIAELASLRFVVATHSPQIIHKWWDRTEPLYRDPALDRGDDGGDEDLP